MITILFETFDLSDVSQLVIEFVFTSESVGCTKSFTNGTVKTCLVSSVDTEKLDRNGVGKGNT